MEYLVGVSLAVALCAFARVVGFDRDRVFYPTVSVVVATYYIVFAAMGNSASVLALESLTAVAFLILAAIGFKKSLWLTVAALVGHGVLDFFHHRIIPSPDVPVWWPGFCLGFDVLAGGILALLLMKRSGFASPVRVAARQQNPGVTSF